MFDAIKKCHNRRIDKKFSEIIKCLENETHMLQNRLKSFNKNH